MRNIMLVALLALLIAMPVSAQKKEPSGDEDVSATSSVPSLVSKSPAGEVSLPLSLGDAGLDLTKELLEIGKVKKFDTTKIIPGILKAPDYEALNIMASECTGIDFVSKTSHSPHGFEIVRAPIRYNSNGTVSLYDKTVLYCPVKLPNGARIRAIQLAGRISSVEKKVYSISEWLSKDKEVGVEKGFDEENDKQHGDKHDKEEPTHGFPSPGVEITVESKLANSHIVAILKYMKMKLEDKYISGAVDDAVVGMSGSAPGTVFLSGWGFAHKPNLNYEVDNVNNIYYFMVLGGCDDDTLGVLDGEAANLAYIRVLYEK